jgi:SAM-dependent methyltransferase
VPEFSVRYARAKTRQLWLGLLDRLHSPYRRPQPDAPVHRVYAQFQTCVAAIPEAVVLEIGARNVTGVTRRAEYPNAARYIGVDIHPGEGVDIVADAHRLSQVVAPASVDAVFSASVFEHLVFPWKAVLEINRVLKPGGYVFTFTHPAWPAHELPWDFWRFPVGGLAALFNPATGFEVISAAEGLPVTAYNLVDEPAMKGFHRGELNAAVAVLARKTADYDPDRLRWDIDIESVVSTQYPPPR